jgi:hypothetical protein
MSGQQLQANNKQANNNIGGDNRIISNQIKIGWDIGIKNMSYCQLRPVNYSSNPATNIITVGANSYQIHGWEIINIVPKVNQFIHDQGEITLDTRPIIKCSAAKNKSKTRGVNTTTGGDICGKTATHCLVSDHTTGYCNTHYKTITPADPLTTIEILPTSCRCWHHEQTLSGSNRCQTGAVIISARNPYIGYCRKHIPSCGLPSAEQLKIIRSRKVASLDLTMLAAALYDELDARPNILYADDVLLENQPVLKNPTMKTMQTFLYSYYVLRGVQSPANGVKTVGDIHCYCASNKLDIIKLLPTEAATDILRRVKDVKSGYGRNKKMAVLICQYLLEHGTGCADLAVKFADKKKQDDLADSLLMTLHFFERANLTKLRTGEAKTKAKAAKSGNNTIIATEISDERQELLAELLPKRGGGKAKLSSSNYSTTALPTTLTNTDIPPPENITIASTPEMSTTKNKAKKLLNPAQTNNILAQLGGKISINLDSPTISDSSLSDGD